MLTFEQLEDIEDFLDKAEGFLQEPEAEVDDYIYYAANLSDFIEELEEDGRHADVVAQAQSLLNDYMNMLGQGDVTAADIQRWKR